MLHSAATHCNKGLLRLLQLLCWPSLLGVSLLLSGVVCHSASVASLRIKATFEGVSWYHVLLVLKSPAGNSIIGSCVHLVPEAAGPLAFQLQVPNAEHSFTPQSIC